MIWNRIFGGESIGGTWNQIEVATHRLDIFEPTRPHSLGWTILYLHDLDADIPLKRTGLTRMLSQLSVRVIAPHAPDSWWSDRICPSFDSSVSAEDYILGAVMEYVQHQWSVSKLAVFGLGMGGQGALRLAFKYPTKFPVVAGVRPFIDHYLRWESYPVLRRMYRNAEDIRQHSATLYVHPLNPPPQIWFCCAPRDDVDWFDSADRLHMKLASSGVAHQCDLTTQVSDLATYSTQLERGLDFVLKGLEIQSQKLSILPKL